MRTLILAIDLGDAPEYQKVAMQRQMADWVTVNKTLLRFENLIIMPITGETRLYWLEGAIGNENDEKTLIDIKERMLPVLSLALNLSIDKDKKYKVPSSAKKFYKQN